MIFFSFLSYGDIPIVNLQINSENIKIAIDIGKMCDIIFEIRERRTYMQNVLVINLFIMLMLSLFVFIQLQNKDLFAYLKVSRQEKCCGY